jgi:hypothetical protein
MLKAAAARSRTQAPGTADRCEDLQAKQCIDNLLSFAQGSACFL